MAAAIPTAGRLTGMFEGIACEYSPGEEEVARLLARRFAEHNVAIAKARAEAEKTSKPAAIIPFSPAEMRVNRSIYLDHIAALLGMKTPTPLQVACYDAFLDDYTLKMGLMQMMRDGLARTLTIRRITIWPRAELVKRLQDSDKVAGFSYDPITKQGRADFGFSTHGIDPQVKSLNAHIKELQREFRMRVSMGAQREGTGTVYRGQVQLGGKPSAPVQPKSETAAAVEEKPVVLPVVIPAELTGLAAPELVEKLWDGSGQHSVTRLLDFMAKAGDQIHTTDLVFADIVLHETTEIGVLDHYFRGPDRRWFCDGVANYVPWRVARDLHGAKVADGIYNLNANLARTADLRGQVDLLHWQARENQSAEDHASKLEDARYAYAAKAVFLMNERAGEDILPRLFKEIGRTKPDRVSMKTVEKAWKNLTHTSMDSLIAETMKP